MKNPMQYFRESFETKKKMMLGGMVLDEVNVPVDKGSRKKKNSWRKAKRQAKRQLRRDCKGPMCQRQR